MSLGLIHRRLAAFLIYPVKTVKFNQKVIKWTRQII